MKGAYAKMKIISDSSSNLMSLEGANYTTVPMKINAGDAEYIDEPGLDVAEMVEHLKSHKGKSGSSCPNVQEWLDAFEGSEDVFGITISGELSGSYNAAKQAAQEFEEEHPGRRAFVFNSKTAGPEMAMLAEKIRDAIREGLDFDAIREKAAHYYNHTHTLFCLESMMNLARNGRVNPAIAKLAGMLGIRVAGEAKNGELASVHKPRGEKKSIQVLLDMMVERGLYDGAVVRVAHCFAQKQALALKELVLEKFPKCVFLIEPTTALCSFYAESGGLIVGFEGSYNQHNHYE